MDWLGPRGRDGGIDTVPLPVPYGGLSLCGKHAIAPDVEAAMAKCDATTVVCLVEARELAGHWPHYVEWLTTHRGASAVWFPIHDLNAPPLDRTLALLEDLNGRLERDEHLLIHCAAGIGRAGTMAACLLVQLGMSVDDALELVRTSRPMAGPEVGPQLDLVRAVAAHREG
jgi:ADP-ribosyl-[dinitrogen reductase] hydrolase